MSLVIRLKVPIEMHYTVIPMGTSKVNSSQQFCSSLHRFRIKFCTKIFGDEFTSEIVIGNNSAMHFNRDF